MMRIRNPLTMLGELRGYLLGVGLVLCMVATAVVFLPQPQKVNAFPGRDPYKGYFYSNPATSGNKVISNVQTDYPNGKGLIGVETTDQFINAIGYFLNSQYNLNDQTGSAFIVLDMLGGFSPGTATIQTAKDNFSTWSAGVRNAQSIDFNFNFSYKINTYYQYPNAPYGGDVAWYYQTAQANSIVINWKEGGRYAIKKDCGNPVGDLATIKSIPNYLSALHVDETISQAKVLMPSNDLNNNISCPSPYTCTSVSRQGNSYSIQLDSNKYTVSNTNTPIGYTYIGWELYKNGESSPFVVGTAPSSAADFIIDQTVNKNFAIVWRYKKNPAQNCLPPSQKVGIGEKAKLTSLVPAPYQWATNAWAATPSTGSSSPFEPSYNQVGNFPVTLTTAGGVVSTCWVIVTQKPYIRAYGGDIFAGSPICTGWPASGGNAGIYGFTGTTVGTGSGAQLGVLAMGPVRDFNSAMLRKTASGTPQPPSGLTFGNTTSTLGNLSGGHCPYDYWGKKTMTTNNVLDTGYGTIDLVNYRWEYYADSARGTVVINPVNIPNGRVVNLYVEGNLLILGNITYAGAGSWGSAADIPRLQIVVKGTIFIDKSVTQLDGVYVAQGGTIYTCTNGAGGVADIYPDCNNQLTVNGALVATRIKWLRTFGHLGDSIAAENPTTMPLRNCTSTAVPPVSVPTCASEIVNLGPEAWMVEQLTANPSADYIQALPPLL
ncbi:MAG: hypothetical protein WCK69_00965 [Candidatus Saccharibacteria bacterium]